MALNVQQGQHLALDPIVSLVGRHLRLELGGVPRRKRASCLLGEQQCHLGGTCKVGKGCLVGQTAIDAVPQITARVRRRDEGNGLSGVLDESSLWVDCVQVLDCDDWVGRGWWAGWALVAAGKDVAEGLLGRMDALHGGDGEEFGGGGL